MPKVIVSPLAQADIDEIWDCVARDSIPNADRFVGRIERRFAITLEEMQPAVAQASRDTRLPIDDFPAQPPFTQEEVVAEKA
jgi:plasmid stabilization system protein ParE